MQTIKQCEKLLKGMAKSNWLTKEQREAISLLEKHIKAKRDLYATPSN